MTAFRAEGIVGEIHVFGGAAMVLAFNARVATRDVDALIEPDGPMLEAAHQVALELGLPRSWLNHQASSCWKLIGLRFGWFGSVVGVVEAR